MTTFWPLTFNLNHPEAQVTHFNDCQLDLLERTDGFINYGYEALPERQNSERTNTWYYQCDKETIEPNWINGKWCTNKYPQRQNPIKRTLATAWSQQSPHFRWKLHFRTTFQTERDKSPNSNKTNDTASGERGEYLFKRCRRRKLLPFHRLKTWIQTEHRINSAHSTLSEFLVAIGIIIYDHTQFIVIESCDWKYFISQRPKIIVLNNTHFAWILKCTVAAVAGSWLFQRLHFVDIKLPCRKVRSMSIWPRIGCWNRTPRAALCPWFQRNSLSLLLEYPSVNGFWAFVYTTFDQKIQIFCDG
jgi:hypothetical protein